MKYLLLLALTQAFKIEDGESLTNEEDINAYINDLEHHMYGY